MIDRLRESAAGIGTFCRDAAGRAFEKTACLIADDRCFFILAAATFAVHIAETVLAWLSFNIIYDFAMFDEAIRNGYAGGPFMYSTLLGQPFLAHHFSPVLIVLVPLHALFRSPWFTLLAHPAIIFASMAALRAALRAAGGFSPFAVNFICLLYLNNPVVARTLLGGFHVEVFTPLTLFSAYYFYLKDRPAAYYAMLAATLAVKEDMGFYLAGMAVFMAVNDKKYRYAFFTAAFSLAWSLAAIHIAMPLISGRAAAGGYPFASRWAAWGGGLWRIARAMAADPARVMGYMFSAPSMDLFGRLLFLPLLGARALPLIFIPWLVCSTSSFELMRGYAYYYGLPLLSFSIIAAVNNLRPLIAAAGGFRYGGAAIKILCCAAFFLNFGHFAFFHYGQAHSEFREKLRGLPRDVSIQASAEIFAHMDYGLKKSAILDHGRLNAGLIVMARRMRDLSRPFEYASAMEESALQSIFSRLEGSGLYKTVFKNDEFIILERAVGK